MKIKYLHIELLCKLKVLLGILFIVFSFQLQATTYYSNSADISNLNNWWTNTNGTGTPHPSNFTTSGDIFIVQSGQTCTATSSIAFTNTTLTVNGTLTPGSGVVISGTTLNGSGTIQVTRVGASSTSNDFTVQYTIGKTLTNLTVEYAGSGTQYLYSYCAFGSLKISNNVTMSGGDWSETNGTLTIASGKTFAISTYSFKAKSAIVNNGTITGSGSVGSDDGDIILSDGTSNYSLSGTGTFYNLKLNDSDGATISGTVTLTGNLAIDNGTLTVNGTLIPASSSVISGGGTISGSGTIQVLRTTGSEDNFLGQYTVSNKTLTNLTVEFAGSSTQYINTYVNYGTLKISNNTTSISDNWSETNILIVATSKTFALGSHAFKVKNTVTNNGSISGSASGFYGQLYMESGSSAYTVGGNGSYYYLKLNDTEGFTVTGNNSISYNFEITSGTSVILNCGTTTTVTGSVNNSGTITGPTTSGYYARVVNSSAVTNSGTIGASSSYIAFSSTINAGGTVGGNVLQSSSQTATCTAAVITVSQSTRTGFSYCAGSGPSSEQTYTVSGTGLTADITITAPTNYQISKSSGAGYASPLTLTQSGGTVSSTTIYVRLKSGLTAGSYNSENISHTSTGATTQNVACSGTVTAPVITVSETTRTAFTYCQGSGPSSSLSYTVSGTCLTADISVTAPTNYEVSTDNTNFYSSRTLTQSGGTVSSTTIYVRLKSGLTVGSYNTENVSHSSTGATTQNVACSGTVTATASVTLASASQVAAANVEQSGIKQALSAFTFAVTTANSTLSQINFTTTGTYTTSDISKFQLWYNTSNSLSGATQIGSDITATLGAGSHSFTRLSKVISSGATGYFWITTNIAAAATTTHTIQVSTISTSDVTFSCASLSGSITAGGIQTIVAATRITYYSAANGPWTTNSTWSTVACGGSAASAYPTATDNVVICNGYTVTANTDIVTTGIVTVNNGGAITISDNVEIDAIVNVESGGIMNWPTTIEIGANANITVNGNISASSTTVVYQDAYAGANKGKITSTGTMAFSQLKSSTGVKGGSLKGSSITISTYGYNEVGVDVAFEGPTTISTYMGYGYTYFTNGDLTITNYNSTNSGSVTENEFVSNNSDLIFTNYVTAKSTTLQTNITGDVYFNAGFENAYAGTPSTRLIAENVYIKTSIKGEGNTNMYIEANLIQKGDITINQNSNGNIYIKKDFDSDGFSTSFNNTNATFKIEGNSTFDNISGHLNSGASIVTLGNSFMKGTGTFGANDGSIYVGHYLTIETLQVSFQGSAKGYIGGAYTAAEFETGGVYDDANYNSDLTIGGTGFHPRNLSNAADATGGNYLSIKGGQITSAAMISDLAAGAAVLDVTPEQWLPIELVSFNIKNSNLEFIEIAWETATEVNNDYFTLYRSNDGIYFEPITEISGAGNSNINIEYSYRDNTFFSGISYYKLSQTDYDGTITYSNIISTRQKSSNFEIVKLCNPMSSSCIFEIQFSDYDESNDLMIINITGEIIYQQVFFNTAFERIDITLPPGVYTIVNTTKNSVYKKKFIVK